MYDLFATVHDKLESSLASRQVHYNYGDVSWIGEVICQEGHAVWVEIQLGGEGVGSISVSCEWCSIGPVSDST